MLFDSQSTRGVPFRLTAAGLAAALLVGSVIYFGPGATAGSILDIVRGESGGANSAPAGVEHWQERVDRDPSDAHAWAALVTAQMAAAVTPANLDRETGRATREGRRAFAEVARSWDRYLALMPQRVSLPAARAAAQALALGERFADAIEAQRAVVKRRPSSSTWLDLARFAYQAGRPDVGDRAGMRAIRRASEGRQRRQIKQQVGMLKLMGQSGGSGLSIGADGQPQIPIGALSGGEGRSR